MKTWFTACGKEERINKWTKQMHEDSGPTITPLSDRNTSHDVMEEVLMTLCPPDPDPSQQSMRDPAATLTTDIRGSHGAWWNR